MNILYISSKKKWGGVFSWMQKTALSLEEKGHSVFILSHPRSKFNQNADKRLKIIPYKLGAEYNPLSIIYLVRFIKKNRIDLLVTNLEKEVGIGGIAAKLSGIPNIRRVGREDDFNNSFKNKWNHTRLVNSSIVPCDYITKAIEKRAGWLKADQFTTIYNGRNSRIFDLKEIEKKRRKWGIREGQLVIGITAQLLPVKQVDQIISVFSKLAEKHQHIMLVITGEGRELPGLKQQVQSLQLSQRVVFSGFTKEPLLTAACYDIALLNSRLEGFPNAIVEYFAAGRPVISTDTGGVNEIIKDGYNGILIKISDEAALFEKLELLIGDAKLRDTYAQNAVKTIRDKFSQDKMIETLEDFFRKSIA